MPSVLRVRLHSRRLRRAVSLNRSSGWAQIEPPEIPPIAVYRGTREVRNGKGVMSFRRAFRITGAQTVLASHWKVIDKATCQLVTEFIRRWRSSEPRATAWPFCSQLQ